MKPQPILVATDGTAGSLGAVRVGCALAEREGSRLHLIAVMKPPWGTVATSPDQFVHPFPIDAKQSEVLRTAVVAQVRGVKHAPRAPAVIEIDVDTPAPAIARYAASIDAGIILVGRGNLGSAERWFGSETVPKVLHLAHVPVLVVPQESAALPRCAVVAMDFSGFSMDAAAASADLLGKDGVLRLAHVGWAPTDSAWSANATWEHACREGEQAQLRGVALKIAAERRLRVETALLNGDDPAAAILRYADANQADLVAAGSHGYGFIGRLVMGSVSIRLVRQAHLPVLIVPPRKVTAEQTEPATNRARFGGDPFADAPRAKEPA
jgi:nucleotide-binding universal stress UspA family protein